MPPQLGLLRHAATATACEAGLVRRVLHGVYLRGDVPSRPCTLKRRRGCSRDQPRLPSLCDRTAAWIWGVDAFAHARARRRTSPRDVRPTRHGTRTRRDRDREAECVTWSPRTGVEIGGVQVTTPLRTALDLGLRPATDARRWRAMDALAREPRRSHAASCASSCRGSVRRRGVIQLRELVPLVRGAGRVAGESHGPGWRSSTSACPRPTLQWWVDVDGVPTYRLDLAYPHARIAIEYDGRDHHTSAADRAARRGSTCLAPRAHGWTVIVVDASDFAPGADGAWLCAVRDALAVRPAASTPDLCHDVDVECPRSRADICGRLNAPGARTRSTPAVSGRGGGGGRRP